MHKKLFFITDQQRVEALEVAEKLPRGSFVILRDYDSPSREELGFKLKKICRKRRLKLLVAGDVRLALRLKADGVHFPEHMAGTLRKWKILRPNLIYTVAAHHERTIRQHKADYYLLSPIFQTGSHPDVRPREHKFARKMAKITPKIVVLGGVNPKNAKTLKNGGFAGLAAVSGFLNCGYNATELAVSARVL